MFPLCKIMAAIRRGEDATQICCNTKHFAATRSRSLHRRTHPDPHISSFRFCQLIAGILITLLRKSVCHGSFDHQHRHRVHQSPPSPSISSTPVSSELPLLTVVLSSVRLISSPSSIWSLSHLLHHRSPQLVSPPLHRQSPTPFHLDLPLRKLDETCCCFK